MAIKLTEAEERTLKAKAQEKVNSMTADEVSKKAKELRIITIILSTAILLIGFIIGIPAIIDDIEKVGNKVSKIQFSSFKVMKGAPFRVIHFFFHLTNHTPFPISYA